MGLGHNAQPSSPVISGKCRFNSKKDRSHRFHLNQPLQVSSAFITLVDQYWSRAKEKEKTIIFSLIVGIGKFPINLLSQHPLGHQIIKPWSPGSGEGLNFITGPSMGSRVNLRLLDNWFFAKWFTISKKLLSWPFSRVLVRHPDASSSVHTPANEPALQLLSLLRGAWLSNLRHTIKKTWHGTGKIYRRQEQESRVDEWQRAEDVGN